MASNPSSPGGPGNPSRSSKTPPKTKRADARPALGVALNWVPPKTPASTKAPAKKRTPAPQ